MKVILATDDGKTLNGHFALSRTFLFYDITGEGSKLLREVDFIEDGAEEITARYAQKKPFRLDERIDAIKGFDLIFVSAIGGPIVDRVMETGVYPMEVNAPEPIDHILLKLRELLTGNQPKWIKRILEKKET